MSKKEKDMRVFKALGNELRLQIIHILSEKGPLCVNALVKRLGVSQSAISQNLKILENAGLIKSKKLGYWVHYSLVPENLLPVLEILKKLIIPKPWTAGGCKQYGLFHRR